MAVRSRRASSAFPALSVEFISTFPQLKVRAYSFDDRPPHPSLSGVVQCRSAIRRYRSEIRGPAMADYVSADTILRESEEKNFASLVSHIEQLYELLQGASSPSWSAASPEARVRLNLLSRD